MTDTDQTIDTEAAPLSPKEARIEKLKAGIASESTPEHIRESMQAMLEELEAPEPPPPAPEPPKPKKTRIVKPKPAPEPPKVELPPPPVPREFNEEDSAELTEKYRQRREKRKSTQDDI